MRKWLLLRSQHSRGKLENSSIILEFHREKFWHCRHVFDQIYLKLCSKITVILLITPDYHPKPDTLIWLQKKSEVSSVFFLCYANQHQRLGYFSSVPLANWKLICPVIFSSWTNTRRLCISQDFFFFKLLLLNQRDLSSSEMKDNSFPKSYWESSAFGTHNLNYKTSMGFVGKDSHFLNFPWVYKVLWIANYFVIFK